MGGVEGAWERVAELKFPLAPLWVCLSTLSWALFLQPRGGPVMSSSQTAPELNEVLSVCRGKKLFRSSAVWRASETGQS